MNIKKEVNKIFAKYENEVHEKAITDNEWEIRSGISRDIKILKNLTEKHPEDKNIKTILEKLKNEEIEYMIKTVKEVL